MRGFDFFPSLEPEDIRDRLRIFQLSTGGKITFRRIPQYTLWEIAFDHGTIPKTLAGRYTSFPKALKAAQDYFRDHPQRKIEIQEELHAP